MQYEYESGIRTTTDGDSIGIPIAGFFVVNVALVIIINSAWGAYVVFKRCRRT